MPSSLETCGFCGSFCRACPLFIGSTEETGRLRAFARRLGEPVEDVTCRGCRSDVLGLSCRACKVRSCATRKAVTFCAECAEFPCPDLQALADRSTIAPGQLLADCRNVAQQGWQRWQQDKAADHACPQCGVVNSAYDLDCRGCGHTPASPFAGRHRDAIARFIAARNAG